MEKGLISKMGVGVGRGKEGGHEVKEDLTKLCFWLLVFLSDHDWL